jgi:hypothetical protein
MKLFGVESQSWPAAAPGWRVDEVLAGEHARMEEQLDAFASCPGRSAGPGELRARWERFERQLAAHLAMEECYLLPAFAEEHPAEAHQILVEHASIKAGVAELEAHLERDSLRSERVAAFGAYLRAHARREEALLYAWARDRLPPDRRSELRAVMKLMSR